MRVLIIGCGYVGLSLGRWLAREGHSVSGIRRTSEGDAAMDASGISPLHADITDPRALARIEPEFDVVVNLASSSKGGVDEYRRVYLEGTRHILAWLNATAHVRYIYTSSTSVYAQPDGSWVTEQSPTEPGSATSQILVETERALQQQSDVPAIILRVSGIYGPERGHLFRQFLEGDATIRGDGRGWINMVHVEDIAGAIVHLITHGQAGGVYNVTDSEPVTQQAFFEWLANELDRPLPSSAPPDPNRKRGLTSKRVSNAKLKAAGYKFKYPTFREGYADEIRRLRLA